MLSQRRPVVYPFFRQVDAHEPPSSSFQSDVVVLAPKSLLVQYRPVRGIKIESQLVACTRNKICPQDDLLSFERPSYVMAIFNVMAIFRVKGMVMFRIR